MEQGRFCYCCRVHHPESQMQRFETRQGERWRCIASIEAAKRSAAERDAFGHWHSEIIREAARRAAATALEARQRAR